MIIDDEPLSRDVLRKYIAEVKDLSILAECPDAFEATHQLNQTQVDIIFLDINMPGLSGISFARSLTVSPLIIFTTAYPEYAVEGFELNAVDYLVKPFSFERFLTAVNRAMEKLQEIGSNAESSRKILVKADKKLYAVELPGILFVEGQGDYIRITLEDKKLVVHETIKNFLGSLPDAEFMRIHKSYVVNLKKIAFVEGNQVRIGEHTLPVSPNHREELLNRYAGS
ncbi:MAG: LytTR family DNA-binding domain-containing protein [Bacteroidota bacterium]